MSFLYEEGVIYKEYQLPATTTSGSTTYAIDFESEFPSQRVILEANGADITFAFGATNTITASATVDGTTKLLPEGNISMQDGVIFATNLDNNPNSYGVNPLTNPRTNTKRLFAAVVTGTGSGTGVIKLVRGI